MEFLLDVLCTSPIQVNDLHLTLHHRAPERRVQVFGSISGSTARLHGTAPGWGRGDLVTLRGFIEEQLDGFMSAAFLPTGHNPVLHVTRIVPASEEQAGIGCGGCLRLFREVALEFDSIAVVQRRLLKVVEANQLILQAVRDVREAARRAEATPTFAFRAVERVRRQVARDAGVRDKKSFRDWQRMHDLLDTSEHELAALTKRAKANRHGDYTPQPWEHRREDLAIAWRAVLRYVMKAPRGYSSPPA